MKIFYEEKELTEWLREMNKTDSGYNHCASTWRNDSEYPIVLDENFDTMDGDDYHISQPKDDKIYHIMSIAEFAKDKDFHNKFTMELNKERCRLDM